MTPCAKRGSGSIYLFEIVLPNTLNQQIFCDFIRQVDNPMHPAHLNLTVLPVNKFKSLLR